MVEEIFLKQYFHEIIYFYDYDLYILYPSTYLFPSFFVVIWICTTPHREPLKWPRLGASHLATTPQNLQVTKWGLCAPPRLTAHSVTSIYRIYAKYPSNDPSKMCFLYHNRYIIKIKIYWQKLCITHHQVSPNLFTLQSSIS